MNFCLITGSRATSQSPRFKSRRASVDAYEQPGSPEEKVTSYKYDKAGRVIEITKPDGVTLNHVYDALGRLDHLTSSDGTVAYSYSYDLHNNPLYVRDEITQCIHKRTYNAWDRVTSDSNEGILGFSYTYDPLGRLTALLAPDSSSVRYLYNQGQLRNIQRCDIAGTQRYEHSYIGFDLRGNVLESRLIGHTGTVRYSWDKKGRITKLDSAHFHQEIPPDGFDAVGNLKKCTFTDAIGEVVQEATYDDLYQLNEERGVKNHTYKNDSLNNRRQKDAKKYALDGLNKLLTDSEEKFTYDKNGNLVEIFSDKRKISLAYDALDRLIKVTNGQEVTSYQYDSLHRRIVKTSNQKTVHFLYFGQREIGLFDPATSTITEFRVLGLGKGAELGASIALELNDSLYCPIHDHRGNIVALVDPTTSKEKECYRYTAFGEREIYDDTGTSLSKSNLHNPWGFASKRHDAETGFVYFSRRYFAPEIGRWITADPAGFADGPNLYAYVHNNPLSRVDLYGLQESEIDRNMDEYHRIMDAHEASFEEALSRGYDHPLDAFINIGNHTKDAWNSPTGREALGSLLEGFGEVMGAVSHVKEWIGFGKQALNKSNVVSSKPGNKGSPKPPKTKSDAPTQDNGVKKIPRILCDQTAKSMPEGHLWKKGPFHKKTADELHKEFIDKGFVPKGPDPMNGRGNYINPKNDREYHIDPERIGRYREPNHVDVGRPQGYNGLLPKKRFPYREKETD